ncbi:MAG: hypothetical protein KF836_08770 [Fimbriimonadaceae bacterium]|nr:hypothetical protein [Fimbriimonadaceae bacterium]
MIPFFLVALKGIVWGTDVISNQPTAYELSWMRAMESRDEKVISEWLLKANILTDLILRYAVEEPKVLRLVFLRFPDAVNFEFDLGTPFPNILGFTLVPVLNGYGQFTRAERLALFLEQCKVFALAGGDFETAQKQNHYMGMPKGHRLEKTVRDWAPEILPDFLKIVELSKRRKNDQE